MFCDDCEKEKSGIFLSICEECATQQDTELTRLRATVDKLPKCWRLNDAGELVQDVPVVPGMALYLSGGLGVIPTVARMDMLEATRYCDSREAAEKRGDA